jgi:hypothetical protein
MTPLIPDPPCWWCAHPDRWTVIDGETIRLEPGETWDDPR